MQIEKKSPISLIGLIIWLLAALFFLYEFFLRTFVGTLARQIIPTLHLTPELFALIGSGYYFAYAIMQIPVGILADRFGVKIIMIFASTLCAIATFLFAHSTDFASAFINRILMGFASSFAFICLLVIAVTWFPRKYFGFFAGASQFIGTMGPLLAGGPLIALLAKAHGNWRITMSEVAGFGIVLAILIFFIVRNKPRGGKQALIYLQPNESLKKQLFRLAKNGQAWAVAAYSATVYASIALLGAIWGTDYLESRHLSQSIAADIISLSWFGYAIGCPLLGALSDIAKRRKPALIFCAIIGFLSTVCLIYLPTQSGWIYGFLFFMLGIAASGQNIGFAAISEHVDLATKATALGLNNGSITLFSAIIPLLTAFLIEQSIQGHVRNPTVNAFVTGLSIMPILYILSFFIALFLIKETYCKPQKESVLLRIK